jgi:hypothetical protein
MQFSDLSLSRRLERAEGHACVEYAVARQRLFPESGAEWIECAGTYAVFDGVDSPITQTFGLSLFEPASPASLDTIENFFRERGAPVQHEVSPFAGVATVDLLCAGGYRPVETSNVLYRTIEQPTDELQADICVRIVAPEESQLWADIHARGWAQEHPEWLSFLQQLGIISSARKHGLCFLAEFDGTPGAAGVLCVHEGIALFGGSATFRSCAGVGDKLRFFASACAALSTTHATWQ